jgi:hypothetical protein
LTTPGEVAELRRVLHSFGEIEGHGDGHA